MSSGFNNSAPAVLGGREPVKVIRDILKSELGLSEKRIMLTNSKIDIDTSPGLYIALSYLGGKAIASNNHAEATAAGMVEVQEVTMRHQIQIDILSADDSARLQKEQVILALNSIFSEQTQELNGLHIGRIAGDFVDVSSLEETKILNRYTMTVNVTSLYSNRKSLAGFYTKFPVTTQNDVNTTKQQFEAEVQPSF